ncbi:MAG: double-strand break repair protein AddB, partial [Hyphomonadaceae bacterium]
MSALFAGPTPRVRAVPASAPFLDVFVEAMAGALWRADAPFALADALVLLPNRRAAQGLIDAFARKLGGAALLPTIRPLGDLDDDPDVWGAEPIELDIAPAIAPTRRRLELAALARARLRAEGGADDPARALAMADELCRLLDSAAAADAPDWAQLPHLVEDIDLAAHWKMSAEFLEIITVYWPQRLKAEGLADPAERRALVLDGLGGLWRSAPPERPIIIAGSTGSIAATRRLMRVVASLPQGVVVLPGLDSDLDDAAWNAIGPQHPQFALKETLAALGLARTQIASLGKETQHGHARRTLIREALAPADATADWLKRLESAGGGAMAKKGLEGAAILEAANADEEAAAIALLLREALETPGQTAAFVTPDAPLARRVGEKLQRWGVTPSASHGRALRETPPGMLLALLCDLARDSGDCVALAALLKHPLARFGLTAEEGARLRPGLERLALRGPR